MTHLLDTSHAFDHPVTLWLAIAAAIALVLTPLVSWILARTGRMSPKTGADVSIRTRTWLFLAPALVIPVILCSLSAMLLFGILSLLCYREFARATGLFRERLLSAIVAAAILALTFAAIDNWYGLFAALPPLTIIILCAAAVLHDRPSGYIQRVALASVSFLLFGSAFLHLAFIANDPNYRAILCMLLACTQGSDILAYLCGRTFGHRPLFPNTSPNKTIGGHLGALILITPLAAWLAHLVFRATPLDTPLRLLGLGLIIAIGAQMGDLVLGSIKRDLGVKDLAQSLPGHGGFTDRCNSLLLVAPAAFHYIAYFGGFIATPAHALTAP